MPQRSHSASVAFAAIAIALNACALDSRTAPRDRDRAIQSARANLDRARQFLTATPPISARALLLAVDRDLRTIPREALDAEAIALFRNLADLADNEAPDVAGSAWRTVLADDESRCDPGDVVRNDDRIRFALHCQRVRELAKSEELLSRLIAEDEERLADAARADRAARARSNREWDRSSFLAFAHGSDADSELDPSTGRARLTIAGLEREIDRCLRLLSGQREALPEAPEVARFGTPSRSMVD